MWPGELIRQFLDTGIVCASRKPRARSCAWSLEGALGWGPGLGNTMCKFRSQGWSSTSGPEAGIPIWGARGRCPKPGLVTAGPEWGGRRRSYLENRARPVRGPRRAARPSAGNTPPHPRRAPAADPARPRRPPWPLARPARCALLAAAAAAAAGPRNRGEITPPNDRSAPGAAEAPAGASPGRASQPIGDRAGAEVANQRPPSRSQPRCSGGRSAAGRSWARKRGAAASPSRQRSAPGRSPLPVPRKPRARQHPRRARFTGLCNGPRSCAAGPRNGRFFSMHCQAAPVCKEREWGALGRGQGARAWWTLRAGLPGWGPLRLG